jgi:preprotein translocase subunit SecE
MSIETKKMSSIAVTGGGNFGGRLKAWPEKIKAFYNDVRNEMRKVTAPSWKEVQGTTTVVIITVFIFALYFGIIDYIIQHGVQYMFNMFKAH